MLFPPPELPELPESRRSLRRSPNRFEHVWAREHVQRRLSKSAANRWLLLCCRREFPFLTSTFDFLLPYVPNKVDLRAACL